MTKFFKTTDRVVACALQITAPQYQKRVTNRWVRIDRPTTPTGDVVDSFALEHPDLA